MLGIYGYVTVKSGKMEQHHRISQPDHTFSESQFCTESVCVYFHHQYHGATVLYYDFYFCPAGIVLLSGRGKMPFDRFGGDGTAYNLSDPWYG